MIFNEDEYHKLTKHINYEKNTFINCGIRAA